MISRVEPTSDRATSMPTIVTTGAEMRQIVTDAQRAGLRVGIVPTMGALHEGHLSLVDAAREDCDLVVASVFVNPTQFGPGEDFESYPRDLDRDMALLAEHGCDYLFAPFDEEVYPDGYETMVDVGSVARPFEGAHRPVHFAGVATVVLKLFNLAPADLAYFGQKDYQQTIVIRRMVADLNVPTVVKVCPTIREPDGLAMSSRNTYLTAEERRRAAGLFTSLQLAEQKVKAGEQDAEALSQMMCNHLNELGGIELDYIAFVRSGTVDEVKTIDGGTVALIAARIGSTRLIDNLEIL